MYLKNYARLPRRGCQEHWPRNRSKVSVTINSWPNQANLVGYSLRPDVVGRESDCDADCFYSRSDPNFG